MKSMNLEVKVSQMEKNPLPNQKKLSHVGKLENKEEIKGQMMDLKAKTKIVEVKERDLEIEKKLDLQVMKSMNLKVSVSQLEKNPLLNQKKLSQVGKLENKEEIEGQMVDLKAKMKIVPSREVSIQKKLDLKVRKDYQNEISVEKEIVAVALEKAQELASLALRDKVAEEKEKVVEELKREKEEIMVEKKKIEKNRADKSSVKVLIQKKLGEVEMVNVKRNKRLTIFFLVVMALTIKPAQVAAKVWTVGGNRGWSPNVNFTNWKENITFFKGDCLRFVYDTNRLNVLEVNKKDYEICSEQTPIRSWKKGVGRKRICLKKRKTYYFIAGNEYCYDGVKLSVSVQDPLPPSSHPLPPSSNSDGDLNLCLSIPVVLAVCSFLLIPLCLGMGL